MTDDGRSTQDTALPAKAGGWVPPCQRAVWKIPPPETRAGSGFLKSLQLGLTCISVQLLTVHPVTVSLTEHHRSAQGKGRGTPSQHGRS